MKILILKILPYALGISFGFLWGGGSQGLVIGVLTAIIVAAYFDLRT